MPSNRDLGIIGVTFKLPRALKKQADQLAPYTKYGSVVEYLMVALTKAVREWRKDPDIRRAMAADFGVDLGPLEERAAIYDRLPGEAAPRGVEPPDGSEDDDQGYSGEES